MCCPFLKNITYIYYLFIKHSLENVKENSKNCLYSQTEKNHLYLNVCFFFPAFYLIICIALSTAFPTQLWKYSI